MSSASILVGTDFSATSHVVLGLAQNIARQAGMALDVRHALPHPAFPSERYDVAPNDIMPLYDAAVARLAKQVASLGEPPKINTKVEVGPITAVLEGTDDCALVAIGHAARTTADRILRGSAATRLVRTAKPPVLIVPSDIQVRPIKKILVCDDFSEPAGRVAQTLCKLGLSQDSEIDIAFVMHGSPPKPATGYVGPDDKLYERARIRGFEELLQERTLELTKELPGTWNSRVIRGLDPAETLLHHANASRADLLAIASTGKGAVQRILLGSVVESIMHGAQCPVLVVH